jgi:hypothetical protein
MALGEAVSAGTNDISFFGYNPASLGSLQTGHASFSLQRGFSDDSFGQVMMGIPGRRGGLGLSVGYYDAGGIQLVDRVVNAQQDITIGLGLAKKWDSFSLGITGKYLNSTLGETHSATALAADIGLTAMINSRLTLGVAAQNYGTKLKYVEAGDELPRTIRAGLSFSAPIPKAPTMLFLNSTYSANRQENQPSVGLETLLGPLAFRAGYKSLHKQNEFTLGAGFLLGQANLDYSFGMINQNDSIHWVTLAFRFSETAIEHPAELVRPTADESPEENITGTIPVEEMEEVKFPKQKETPKKKRITIRQDRPKLKNLEKIGSK